MTTVRMTCGYCQWTDTLTDGGSRADQNAYNTIWQHVAAAHWQATADLRSMGIRERKDRLLSWATMTETSPTKT